MRPCLLFSDASDEAFNLRCGGDLRVNFRVWLVRSDILAMSDYSGIGLIKYETS